MHSRKLNFFIMIIMGIFLSACGSPKPAETNNDSQSATKNSHILPRNETLYFNGWQWGAVVGWNPYSNSNNNGMVTMSQMGRVIMFETPYLYNMLNGKVYPLLADGDYEWNPDGTELRFKIKKAAHWCDGTPVTAEDFAYTWKTHIKYNTPTGYNYKDYIETIEVLDDRTVVIKASLDENGRTINPLLISSYITTSYVIQKNWTAKLEKRTGGNAANFLTDPADDVVSSGPYRKFFNDESKVILVRDEDYWGQDESMWGKLPVPRYLAHTIFKDNASGTVAFTKGEVDVSQQFNPNIEQLWLNKKLPISTYLPDPPYNICTTMLTAFYNLDSYGLDQPPIRNAIAIAVDYNSIISNAFTNQSPTFDQVPRSLMNPLPMEQALYNHDEVKHLQWKGNDIEGAKKLLDETGITDSDGDGWREYKGKKLSFTATCPSGWSDSQAAIEILAVAGKNIGIEIKTNFPEWSVFQSIVSRSDIPLPDGYDIFIMPFLGSGADPAQPWLRTRNLLSSEWIGMVGNFNGNFGRYSNPEVDRLLRAIPGETDPAEIKKMYTELVRIYLTDVPSFFIVYRAQANHAVNESVWTNFPRQDDGSNPPIPPLNCIDGWGIAALYNLKLVNP